MSGEDGIIEDFSVKKESRLQSETVCSVSIHPVKTWGSLSIKP